LTLLWRLVPSRAFDCSRRRVVPGQTAIAICGPKPLATHRSQSSKLAPQVIIISVEQFPACPSTPKRCLAAGTTRWVLNGRGNMAACHLDSRRKQHPAGQFVRGCA
jgi:hypothetical protein